MKSKLNQSNNVKTFTKNVTEDSERVTKYVCIQYDDTCKNGHNTFSITCDTYRYNRAMSKSDRYWISGGCDHDSIIKYFPKLKKYIKWHLVSSNGPFYYIANTVYHASSKDFNGLEKGEVKPSEHMTNYIYFNNVPMPHELRHGLAEHLKANGSLELIAIKHPKEPDTYGENYIFKGMVEDWYKCPFTDKKKIGYFKKALKQCQWIIKEEPSSWKIGKGKTPDLKSARLCAIWEDATLEQLSDEKVLKARLPKLIKEFKYDIEKLGFAY